MKIVNLLNIIHFVYMDDKGGIFCTLHEKHRKLFIYFVAWERFKYNIYTVLPSYLVQNDN